jgi:hypothetical protein
MPGTLNPACPTCGLRYAGKAASRAARSARKSPGNESARVIGDQNACVMPVAEDRFRDFVGRGLSRAIANAGFVTSLPAGSEQEVNETVATAIAASRGPSWENAGLQRQLAGSPRPHLAAHLSMAAGRV